MRVMTVVMSVYIFVVLTVPRLYTAKPKSSPVGVRVKWSVAHPISCPVAGKVVELLLLRLVQPCVGHLAELAGMVVLDVHFIVFPPPKITAVRR